MSFSMNGNALAKAALAAVLAVSLCPAPALADGGLTAADAQLTQSSKATQASARKSTTGTTNGYVSFGFGDSQQRKAGGAVFQQKRHSGNGSSICDIVMTKGGATRTLVQDADFGMATNGKYLFYSMSAYEPGTYYDRSRTTESTIYRMNLSTGERTAVVSGASLMVNAATSARLYYSVIGTGGSAKLYARSLKTGAKKAMSLGSRTSIYALHVECAKGRVVVQPGAVAPIYSFKQSGAKRKKIVKSSSDVSVNSFSIRKGRVYYTLFKGHYDYSKGKYIARYKAVKCSVLGKGKKAVVKWTANQGKAYKYGW